MLKKQQARKNLNIIGLNSGTSADGIDLAAVKVNIVSKKLTVKFLAGKTIRYPAKLQSRLHDAIDNRMISIDEFIRLDRELGHFYGMQAERFRRNLKNKGVAVNLVASHGQTVRHLPGKVKIDRSKQSATLQLGHPETIAATTGLLTVADFRQSDIACGGEGAPITTTAMHLLFADKKNDRMLVNIGGISNYFFFPRGKNRKYMTASDCGPGNSLIDIIAKKSFGKNLDRNGSLAARGNISKRLLSIMSADSFLKGKYGPSTGKERFGGKFADKIIRAGSKLRLNKYDIMATTTELTAVAIMRAIKKKLEKHNINHVYLLGGGLKNKYLLKRMHENMPGVRFISVSELGYDPDYLEAVCYAVMGAMTVASRPSGLYHVTGAAKDSIAGRIIQP